METNLKGWGMKWVCIASLAFMLAGCAWLEKQNVDICVVYRGKHVCVGRLDGKWVISANDGTPLSLDERNEIISKLGQ